jgi:RNA polymerase sigma factor (sigma-70 family)
MHAAESRYPPTQWTAIVEAARSDVPQQRAQALAELCRDYWLPLFVFSQRLGHAREDAEDLTQGFFGYVLEHDVLSRVRRDLGTLRTFLLRAFQRYMRDVAERGRAAKRGGGQILFSLNDGDAAVLNALDFAGADTPEMLFDRAWAHAVLRGALADLGALERDAGRARAFAVLEPCLNPESAAEGDYQGAAAALEASEDAVRQAVSRLRKKFRESLRARIAATLQDPDEARVDEELGALKMALRQ